MKNIIFLLIIFVLCNSCSRVSLADLEKQTIQFHEKEYYILAKELDINQFRGFYKVEDHEVHTKSYEFICFMSNDRIKTKETRVEDDFSLILGKQLEHSIKKNNLFKDKKIRILLSISAIPKISEMPINAEKEMRFVNKRKQLTLYMQIHTALPSH